MKKYSFLVLFFVLCVPFYAKGEETMTKALKPVASSAEEICPVLEGMKIPDETVKTVDGSEVSLNDVVAKKPTVLIFYRGGW